MIIVCIYIRYKYHMLLSNVQIYDYLQIINEQNYIGIRNFDIHKTLKRSIYYFFNSLDHKFPDDHSCTEVHSHH